MAKMRKELFIVLMTAVLGVGALAYFNSCAAAEALLDAGGLKDVHSGGGDTICTPACDGKKCGDDGCGGVCGTCKTDETCNAGVCEPKVVPDGGATDSGATDGCTADCTNKLCGDDGCGGSCGTCSGAGETCTLGQCVGAACQGKNCGDDDGAGNKCFGPCTNSGDTCTGGPNWACACTPDCNGKVCGPDGCGATCGSCQAGDHCVGGTCEPIGGDTCVGDCTNKGCGDDDGCGGTCDGKCPNADETCVSHACVKCTAGTCDPNAACGDWDSKQCKKCGGTCTDANKICLVDSSTGDPACSDNPCLTANCGDTGSGVTWTCPGNCTTSGQSCQITDPATQKFGCQACDVNGGAAGATCDANTACKCGTNCVTIFTDQKSGVCQEDCFATKSLKDLGTCTDTTQACEAMMGDTNGNIKSAECYVHAPLTGNFSAAVMDDCTSTPTPGTGSLTYTIGGTTYKWTANFSACHATGTNADGTTYDYINVGAYTMNGTNTAAEIVSIVIDTSKVALGDLPQGFGYVMHEHYTLTVSGGQVTITAVSTVALGVRGTANLTQAGTGGKKVIKGTVNMDMLLYKSEVCGGSTGTPCQ